MKTVVWLRIGKSALLERLQCIRGLTVAIVEDIDELAREIGDAGILVLGAGDYKAEVATLLHERASSLRLIQLLTAGYEGLELHGVPAGAIITTAGESWSPAVAEHAMTLVLALFKQLPMAFSAQANSIWSAGTIAPLMRSPNGQTLVIIGCGSIGRHAARLAHAFGMRVIGVSRSGRRDAGLDAVFSIDQLHVALATGDAILVCVPSNAQTRGMIGAAQIAQCKDGALLVNVSRGNVVDRSALADALRKGKLAGAGIDVTDPEPLQPGDPLWGTPNLIITPHVSGFSGAPGYLRLAEFVADNLTRFLAGQSPLYKIEIQIRTQ